MKLRAVAQEVCSRLDAELGGDLGHGAFKEAYFAKHRGREIALKIAPVGGELAQSRLERETAALQKCNHAAIARLYFTSSIDVGGKAYLVIGEEFLPNGTLADRLAHGPLSSSVVRELAVPLSDALAHLQSHGFVHRDIKPANILFRSDSEPVLTDFGVVRVLGAPSLTHDFQSMGPGTPLYASPEQLRNEKALIDWRSDQFGLALVLAEALLGRPAFQSAHGDALEAVQRVANREVLGAETVLQLQGLGFAHLVKALSPWPVQRYRNPEDFKMAHAA